MGLGCREEEEISVAGSDAVPLSAWGWWRASPRPGARARRCCSRSATTCTSRWTRYSLHLFVLVVLCYGIMTQASIANVHRYSFLVAMGYLTLCHISRKYIFNYGILATDFSGPLMIITQKISSLAFQVHDGMGRSAEDLTPDQFRLAVKTRPSFLEYLSYHLNFMSILAGPCSSYKDYIAFIEGRHVHMKLLHVNWKQRGYDGLPDPSPNGAVIHKLCITLVTLVLFLTLSRMFPVIYLTDDKFISEASIFSRLGYMYISIQAFKQKYYFAWTLADAVNNAAGYGFSGMDERGNFQWDLISNLNIWNIETATSFKMYLDNWNIQTAAWLRCVCYDRMPRYPIIMTFLLSALWHGVYPGYYFTFATGIPMVLASRTMRSNFRHYFVSSKTCKLLYDIFTWMLTQLAVVYTAAPFVMLALGPTIKLYKSMYFHFHVLSILALLLLPMKPQHSIQRRAQTTTTRNCVNNKKKK
ncbi:lysophospholipid acyltransferase 1 isoform X2 [Rhinatrema bivittatum]|uniref:lysophospholipid acyltransferase 1 isoform X2 n=1 Tax=Rhinatrema bivittatum TaxID=194408 RepID=UPI001128C045|nr:lysophospholipid acyltransferase 1 isoform X2 [Rhinatrema bivittatum]